MARADATSVCVQSDSIKGLAQSIANPGYYRLMVAEPALRRAVPILIIAFLITIGLGACMQGFDQSRQKRDKAQHEVAALADILAERLDRLAAAPGDRPKSADLLRGLLPDLIPNWSAS